ncbi:hypothetical protein, partial [Maribellus maritimus]|uniref:hypothetical protein n=1 Tax=Maribellus maritimus TaxID=2870838 RepID=UPI001EECB703
NRNATRNHNVNNRKQTLPKNFQCGILYLKWYNNSTRELNLFLGRWLSLVELVTPVLIKQRQFSRLFTS